MIIGEIASPFKEMLEQDKTREHFLPEDSRKDYRAGLSLLGMLIDDNFLNVPKIPNRKFETEGLFYTIDYFDSERLWSYSNTIMLMAAYKIENKTAMCPFNIEWQFHDMEKFKLIFNDNEGINGRSMSWVIFGKDGGDPYTEMSDIREMKFSDLVNYTKKIQEEKRGLV